MVTEGYLLFVRQISAISAPKEMTNVNIPMITVISSKSLISSPPSITKRDPTSLTTLRTL